MVGEDERSCFDQNERCRKPQRERPGEPEEQLCLRAAEAERDEAAQQQRIISSFQIKFMSP